MKVPPGYAEALAAYVQGPGEAGLLGAYQLGRDALQAGVGVLEWAAVHQAAVQHVLRTLPAADHARAARCASEFFAEALAPFEMSQRGLRGQVEEHRRLERMKNEFISLVSHELRTPLTSIHGALDLVTKGAAGGLPESARRLLEIAFRNSQRLVRLVNDILDLQRIESGEVRFELRPVDLTPLLEQAVEANQAYAARFDVELALREGLPPLRVVTDPDRTLQVLTNLLGNAAKFSPPGAVAIVGAEAIDGRARVSVSDRGPGIPPEFQARVFGRFAQADASPTRKREGTGLGLSISKALVERMGGQIGFVTEAGVGTTFHFELPLGPHASAE